MFDDSTVDILNKDRTWQKTISGDFQAYSGKITIDEYEFEITKRLFVETIEPSISMSGYLKIENKIYKILHIKTYSDYQEVWLYELVRQSEVI